MGEEVMEAQRGEVGEMRGGKVWEERRAEVVEMRGNEEREGK